MTLMPRKCIECGRTWQPTTHRQLSCSEECRRRRKRRQGADYMRRWYRADPAAARQRAREWLAKNQARVAATLRRYRAHNCARCGKSHQVYVARAQRDGLICRACFLAQRRRVAALECSRCGKSWTAHGAIECRRRHCPACLRDVGKQAELARRYGVSRQYVGQLMQRERDMLRDCGHDASDDVARRIVEKQLRRQRSKQ